MGEPSEQDGEGPFRGEFQRVELPGGVHLHLAPTRKFKTVGVKVFLRTDLARESATEVAALPYVLRRGTRRIPSLRGLSQALEDLFGASLGMDVLKLGEEHVLTLGVEVLGERFLPRGETLLPQAIELLGELLLDPARDAAGALRAEEVRQEKEKLRRLIEGLVNDKGVYAAERLIATMCADEPFGVFEYGRLEELEALDGARLEARRQRLVREAPLDVYAVGAFDPAQMVDLVGRALAGVPRGEVGGRGTTPHPPERDVRHVREEMPGISQSRLCLGLRVPVRVQDPEFWTLWLLNGVLGAFPHSKLFRNVREGAGLCYDASSTVERFKGLLFVFAGVDGAELDRARDLCLEQLAAIARGELTADELENTREAFRQGYQTLLDTPQRLVNRDYLHRLGGRGETLEEAVAALEAVRPEDISTLAGRVRLDTVYALSAPAAAASAEPEEG